MFDKIFKSIAAWFTALLVVDYPDEPELWPDAHEFADRPTWHPEADGTPCHG